jgi:hypothetical protein
MSDTEDKYEHVSAGAEAINVRTSEGPHFGKQARHEREKTSRFERVHMYAEFVSFLVIIASGPIAIFELHDHTTELRDEARKESLELAQTVYLTVDRRFADFTKLCLENPRLDCYSVQQQSPLKRPLTETERLQQRILYSDLTDVFEVAFVQYHRKEVSEQAKKLFDSEWGGWDAYIKKFMKRKSYQNTWSEIHDEYDTDFADYMDKLAKEPSH